ncbi:prepilin-type N-terminal cleavage/methylation domain-containing protein [Desulfonatronum thiodismutans]|uniref:prepilin-type N-terminal cleavage/methylation domain-containing protein n=1 Tax=Desulfonatronum thiodismutans TaxID=159290 RepID=UPI001377AF4D|nr:prepilin-type N-terminal cleavage/methylation domain-containing protein [Desulfonatronum thiodismutans]
MKKSPAFSLIELIITLLLVGIFAVMIVPFFQSGVYDSVELLQTRQELYELNTVMSRIVADYEVNHHGDLSLLSTAIGDVGAHDNDDYGKYYVVSKTFLDIAGGSSNGLEVTFATPDGLSPLTYLFTEKTK